MSVVVSEQRAKAHRLLGGHAETSFERGVDELEPTVDDREPFLELGLRLAAEFERAAVRTLTCRAPFMDTPLA